MFGLSKKERQQRRREDRIFQVFAMLAVERRAEFERKELDIRERLHVVEQVEALGQARRDFETGLRMVAYHDALRIVAQAEAGLACAKTQGDFRIFEAGR